MNYSDKLRTSFCAGGAMWLYGAFVNNPVVVGTGLGLIVSSIFAPEEEFDEFSDLRNEFERRERAIQRDRLKEQKEILKIF